MYMFIKRLFDFLLSLIALIILLPLFLLISLLIKIDSKGPIFFIQKRIGIDGKVFPIYKFRSMKTNTPNIATDKLGDPSIYITKLGMLLRKTSMDELPQLINILIGDMSIIGPRPALYNQFELIEKRKEFKIDTIKPGLTGYAQVMGRDYISENQKVKYDKYYLENMSLLLDLKIFIKTIKSVFISEGIRTN